MKEGNEEKSRPLILDNGENKTQIYHVNFGAEMNLKKSIQSFKTLHVLKVWINQSWRY